MSFSSAVRTMTAERAAVVAVKRSSSRAATASVVVSATGQVKVVVESCLKKLESALDLKRLKDYSADMFLLQFTFASLL